MPNSRDYPAYSHDNPLFSFYTASMRVTMHPLLWLALALVGISGVFLFLNFYTISQRVVAPEVDPGRYSVHITAILPDEAEPFFQAFMHAAEREAMRQEIALEFLPYSLTSGQPELILRRSLWMGTDGVLVYLPEENQAADEIELLQGAGIPVVTLINDSPLSGRSVHLGYDFEGIARELVRLMHPGEVTEPQRWALLLADDVDGKTGRHSQRIESVVHNILQLYPLVTLAEVSRLEPGYFAAEQAVVQFMRSGERINGIIAGLPYSIGGVLQGLIDQHRLGNVSAVGMDTGAGVVDAVTRNLLNGVVYRYPEDAGRQGVQVVHDLISGKEVPEYIDLAYSAVDSPRSSLLPGEQILKQEPE